MIIHNTPERRTSSSIPITINVVNRSHKDVTNGTVVVENEYASATATFGPIARLGGSASITVYLDGYAVTAKAAFYAADNTQWVGLMGNGQAFDIVDINLNDPKA